MSEINAYCVLSGADSYEKLLVRIWRKVMGGLASDRIASIAGFIEANCQVEITHHYRGIAQGIIALTPWSIGKRFAFPLITHMSTNRCTRVL